MVDLSLIKKEVETSIQDPQIQTALLTSVFKGFQAPVMKQAIMEGMIRGFAFRDFLEKNIYAIPYGQGYSLVTSIDYARKIAMRGGLAGKDEPLYTAKPDGKPISCAVTVKKVVAGTLGNYTAKVFFDEYYAGHKNEDGTIKSTKFGPMKPNLWDTKPYTMIAKVAEMHALRMAFPEELAQAYVEEEMVKESVREIPPTFDIAPYRLKLEGIENLTQLRTVWSALPGEAKKELESLKNEIKERLTPKVPGKTKKVEETSTQILSDEEEANIQA